MINYISPQQAHTISGQPANWIREMVKDANRRTGGNPDEMRRILGYAAEMHGNHARINEKSYRNYLKRMEE